MTEQYQYPQPDLPYPGQAPKKKKRWVHPVAYSSVAILGVVIGAVSASGEGTASSSPQPTVTVTQTVPAEPATTEPTVEETTPEFGEPTKAHFKLTVKTLKKQCFGSAGCNVTFRILISYTGPDLDPSKEYEVLYEVRGGEDGPITNTFTVTGGESSVDREEMVSTSSSKAKLTAVVTDIL